MIRRFNAAVWGRVALRSRRMALMVAVLVPVAGPAPTGFPGPVTDAAGGPGGSPRPASRDLAALCGGLSVIRVPDGRALCTHGPDPAPPGIDIHQPQPLVAPGRAPGLIFPDPPGEAPSQAAATPGIACHGDGTSGNRVHALYAVPADRVDRYDKVLPSIRQWAAEMDAVFQASAAKTGGTRRIRFVTAPNCDLVVDRVRLSARGDDTFDNTIVELAAQGYRRADRKYVVWMDSTALCGVGTYYIDDQPGQGNFNNGNPAAPGSVDRIDAGCWGLGSQGQSVEAHELMHSLGAVLPTAPNATAAGHCTDDADRMCYADGSLLLTLRTVCRSDQEALFDCDGDDYFSTAPRPGSFPATRWNTASSSFLSTSASTPSVSIGDASVNEGNTGTTPVTVSVTLSGPSSQPVSMRFATADGAARTPDDYLATSGTLTFNPGETSKPITVSVQGDRSEEVDEPFQVILSSPTNALLERAQGFVTILDDEPAPGQGYWFVAADGGIFAFGDAGFFGSTGNIKLNQPIVGMASTPTGNGYWFVARDGGIFAYGDARFFGSIPDLGPNQSIVGMASTPTGNGYWFVAQDGAIFAYGDARSFGAPAGAAQPIVAMSATPTGGGYWMTGQDGAVYAFGDARPLGGASGLNQPVVGMAGTPKGGGYWLVARDGGIFSFADARFLGSTGNIRLNQPIVGMTAPLSLHPR